MFLLVVVVDDNDDVVVVREGGRCAFSGDAKKTRTPHLGCGER